MISYITQPSFAQTLKKHHHYKFAHKTTDKKGAFKYMFRCTFWFDEKLGRQSELKYITVDGAFITTLFLAKQTFRSSFETNFCLEFVVQTRQWNNFVEIISACFEKKK